MDGISAIFPNPFAKKPTATPAAEAKPAAAPAPSADQLKLTTKPAADATAAAVKPVALVPARKTGEVVMGVGSAAVGVGIATWALAVVAPAFATPVLIGGAALAGVLALCGVGLAQNWGDKKPMLHTALTKVAGGIGMASTTVGGAIIMAKTAMSFGGFAGMACWGAAVLATLCMGALTWGVMKAPVPTPGLPKP